MSDLAEVLERVKAASGPDRELDAAVTIAIGDGPGEGWALIRQDTPGVFKMDAGRWIKGNRIRTPQPFTASIDTSLALVERLLPGWGIEVGRPAKRGGIGNARLYPGDERNAELTFFGMGENPALAILAALLSALVSQEPSP